MCILKQYFLIFLQFFTQHEILFDSEHVFYDVRVSEVLNSLLLSNPGFFLVAVHPH
jgi:hypothetical protein